MHQYEIADLDAINNGMLKLVHDLLDRGGKRWRPTLGMIFAEAYGRDITGSTNLSENGDIMFACGLTEIVHNGSLMVDDLEDKSLMRRNEPCIHIKYGDDYAVNTGNFMYYAPMTKLSDFVKDDAKKLQIYEIYQQEMLNIHFGQNWDIHWHNGKKMPTEEQYM